MNQPGLFDYTKRLARIDNAGNPLAKLNKVIDLEQFREIIELSREKLRKSSEGAKGYDSILMFKILIIQALYNLSDGRPEFQVLDYYSFSRFLGTGEGAKANVVELLFTQFLRNNGFKAQKGQIVVYRSKETVVMRTKTLRQIRKYTHRVKASATKNTPTLAGQRKTLSPILDIKTTSV